MSSVVSDTGEDLVSV